MEVITSWSSGREPTAGLDQLGIRGNSTRMYDHLVPGITNLTNRVRYYSMHAWFIHWWAKNIATDEAKAFNRKLRIFECIMGMAETVRNYGAGEETQAITGSDTFKKWLRENGGVESGTIVPLDDLSIRYWKHSGGGFGQYYKSSAKSLGIVSDVGNIVGLTPEYGVPLAESFQNNAVSIDIERMLRNESATVGQLRKLSEHSSFQDIHGKECSLLQDLLFDVKDEFGPEGNRRRNALLMLLSLAHETDTGIEENPLWQVFDVALDGCTSDNKVFRIPSQLAEYFDLWKTYAIHEYFAFAFEALLAVAVHTVGEKEIDGGLISIEELARIVSHKIPQGIAKTKWGDLVRESMQHWSWPALDPGKDPFNEWTLREIISEQIEEDNSKALETALKLLARVIGRIQGTHPYANYIRGKMDLMGERISLLDGLKFSVAREELSCRDYLLGMIAWGLRSHLRLAAAKLISTGVYTYKIAYRNGFLTKVERMSPALSSPRLQQATRMLTDLGLLQWKGNRIFLSAEGNRFLERYGCQ